MAHNNVCADTILKTSPSTGLHVCSRINFVDKPDSECHDEKIPLFITIKIMLLCQ